jgi:hypothetical protein
MTRLQSRKLPDNPLPRRRRHRKKPSHVRLRDAMVGDRNSIAALAADDPRKKVTLPRCRFLENDEVRS